VFDSILTARIQQIEPRQTAVLFADRFRDKQLAVVIDCVRILPVVEFPGLAPV